MLTIGSQSRIFVCTSAVDMRKGINGLSGLIRTEFESDPLDGSLFVFINRRRDRMKILHFADGGFWLFYRVLEAGTFEMLRNLQGGTHRVIDATELSMLLSGVSLSAASRRRTRYGKPAA